MSTSYKDLEFSLSERLIMVKVNKHPISKELLYQDHYKFLAIYSLVDRYQSGSDMFCLNEKGRMYLRYHSKSNRKYIITTAIAIFAAVGAYRSELAYLLQELVKLLK